MRKWRKRVKNLQIYLTAITLILSGCSLNVGSAGAQEDQYESVEGSSFFGLSNVSEDSNDTYFNRTYNSSLDYEGMILTLEEKGIKPLSEEAKATIQKVSLYNSIPYDFSWVELFSIDDFYYAAYTNDNVASRVTHHHDTQFYNSLTDSIDWNKLTNCIINNSNKIVSKDESGELIALSSSDIKIILDQLSAFVADVKKEYQEYDMQHLACQLSSLSFAYRNKPSINSTTLASTSYCSIEWYLNEEGEYPVLKTSLMLNEHEFKHFLCSYCRDEISGESVYITPSGVIYGANTSLNFTFIEEATAEEFAAERNGREPVTYYEKIAALDTLRFVLSLQDDYCADGFVKYSFLQNPLAIVQQFPVLDDSSYYFTNNLKMLASYNACLSSAPAVFVSAAKSVPGYENFYNNLDQRKEVFSSLGTYASAELSRLFFTDLVVMNDTKDTMSLEYNFYLMRLFEKRMEVMFSAMSDYQKFNMSSANYKQIYQEMSGEFFKYLSSEYKVDLRSVRELYNEYSLDQAINFPPFVADEIQSFYKTLETEEYDKDQLKENFEEQLQYYIQYSSR